MLYEGRLEWGRAGLTTSGTVGALNLAFLDHGIGRSTTI